MIGGECLPLSSLGGDKKIDELLLRPYFHLQQVPGKNFRSKLATCLNHWLRISDEKLKLVQEIVETLHNASLLVDDVQDDSVLRRGIPVAHSIYGVPSTLRAANYAVIIALQKCQQLENFKAARVCVDQLLELQRGQGMDVYWRDNLLCPSEEEYVVMTKKKTGGMFTMTARLMQLVSGTNEDFTRLTGLLGVYFQIRDDYINLCSDDYMQLKTFCEDISEGKFSFPLIHAITSQPGDKQVLEILQKRTDDVELKKRCVSLLEEYGSFEYTRRKLIEIEREIREEVEQLGGNPYLGELFQLLGLGET